MKKIFKGEKNEKYSDEDEKMNKIEVKLGKNKYKSADTNSDLKVKSVRSSERNVDAPPKSSKKEIDSDNMNEENNMDINIENIKVEIKKNKKKKELY